MMSRLRTILDLGASAAMISVAALLGWMLVTQRPKIDPAATSRSQAAKQTAPVPTEPISIAGSPSLGDVHAKVVLVMFSDFECPFCSKFAQGTLPSLIAKEVKEGAVRLVFKFMPLEQIHPHARQAALSAACSGQQGKFWEAHDLLFAGAKDLGGVSTALPRRLNLNQQEFSSCLKTIGSQIDADSALASALAVRGTPTLMLGEPSPDRQAVKVTRTESGAIPYQALTALLADATKGGTR